MNWMLNIVYFVIFTTISGSLVTLLWSILGRILERAGFLNVSYDLMRKKFSKDTAKKRQRT